MPKKMSLNAFRVLFFHYVKWPVIFMKRFRTKQKYLFKKMIVMEIMKVPMIIIINNVKSVITGVVA